MAYDWDDYRGYLSTKIAESGVFVNGYPDEWLIDAMIDQANDRGHTVVGKNTAETFIFESLTYGIKSMAERTGLNVQQYEGPALAEVG